MSLGSTGLPAGLAATGMANAPSWVRNGSAEVQKDYALGLEFEQMLANELASSMTATAGLGESQGSEEEGSGSALGGAGGAGGPMSTLLSSAFAEGVAGGGLGLAAEIARDLQSRTGTAPATGAAAPSGLAPAAGGVTAAETTGGTGA